MKAVSQHIVRNSLHDTLVAYIRELIMQGELRPGDKVPEQQLCERFGVSRTPMREALKVLAAEGVLQLVINRGAIVAHTTQEEIEELFPIMAALESVAGEYACKRATARDIARVRKLHDEMIAHYKAGKESAYLRNNRAIHEAIFELAGNATLAAMYQQLLTRIHSIRFVIRKSSKHWEDAVREHEQIIAALEARDGPRLGQLLKEHVTGTTVGIAEASINKAKADENEAVNP
jgi:DNA-binding GntR family transcriptional regulator